MCWFICVCNQILSSRKLGFTKVKAPNSHHRKRLAVESRRHSSPDDSHMFIIKLPPNFVYYTNPKGEANSITDNSQKANVSTIIEPGL